jgi:hypothetical protein
VTDIFPEGVSGQGTTRIALLDTLASTTAPSAAVLNGASAVDATPYFRVADFGIGHAQGVADDTRLSDANVRQSFGRSTWSADNFRYVYDPQGDPDDPGNLMYGMCEPGTTKYAVLRYGLASATTFATSQKVDVYQVMFGNRHKINPGNDDNAKHLIDQPVSWFRVTEDAVVAA